jgi:hypothetical protein
MCGTSAILVPGIGPITRNSMGFRNSIPFGQQAVGTHLLDLVMAMFPSESP